MATNRRFSGVSSLALATVTAWFLPLALVTAPPALAATKPSVIEVVGAENQYANVLSQIGGRYIHVVSILNNPTTDPHTFEASTSVARDIQRAQLIVQNGLGYDSFMNKIEDATPSSTRRVIVVRQVLGLPSSTPNPHLWYAPSTMPRVARVAVDDLSQLQPQHRAYFVAQLARFDASLVPWTTAIATFRRAFAGDKVATTEPVADYLLTALGLTNVTPFIFQADIMNGVDPAPEDVALEEGFLSKHAVKVFCYNEQVVDSLTSSFRSDAQHAHVPIVAVYETMPTGYTYQSWMLAEVHALSKALTRRQSTTVLP